MPKNGTRQTESIVSGFTPVFDVVVQGVGLTGAMVFGKIWRYCQMRDGVCRASKERLAKESNMSTRSFVRWAKRLVEAGYLEDMTPDLKNRPHIYRDTGKVKLVLSAIGMTESHTGMTESQTRYDRKSEPGMTESHLKILEKKQEKIQERDATTSLSPILPSGQHQGKTLQQVLEIDPGYLKWVAGHWGSESIRLAAKELLEQVSDAELEAERQEALNTTPIDVYSFLAK